MHPKRATAIALRKEGRSYREIEKTLQISRSSLSYMLRNVQLTPKQQATLAQRQIDGQQAFVRAQMERSPEERRALGRYAGLRTWQRHHDKQLQTLREASVLAGLTYRHDELPIKEALERRFGQVFQKEHILGRFFDFCSSTLIIEHSYDGGKGVNKIIERFEAIAQVSGRRKIAFVSMKSLGSRRMSRISGVVDEIWDAFGV